MRENAAVLQDKQCFCDTGLNLGLFLRLAPFQRLDLHLPIDSSKAATLFQYCLQEDTKGCPGGASCCHNQFLMQGITSCMSCFETLGPSLVVQNVLRSCARCLDSALLAGCICMLAECIPCMLKGNAECDLSVMSDAAESSA